MVDIPIQQNDRHIQLIATGGQTQFDADFLIFKETDFTVKRSDNSVSPPIITTLTLNIDYTVTGTQVLAGFSVFLTAASFPTGAVAGDLFTIFGEITIARPDDFQVAGAFNANVVNLELDTQTQILQEINTKLDRSLRMFEEDDLAGIDNRLPLDRASKFAAYDANKNPTAITGVTLPSVAVSVFMATVLAATTAASARTTLGAAKDSGAWKEIQSIAAAASTTIDFVLPTGFDAFRIRIIGAVMSVDGDEIGTRVSNDGGATHVATANYFHVGSSLDGATSLQGIFGNAAATTLINLVDFLVAVGIGNGAGESLTGVVEINNARSAALFTEVRFTGSHIGSGGSQAIDNRASGHYNVAEDNDGIQLLPLTGGTVSAGNFTSGTFVLEGLVT